MKNWVDWVIALLLISALIRGYRAGLLSTLFSVIGYLGGGFGGLLLSVHYVSKWQSSLNKFLVIIIAISVGASIGEGLLKRFAKAFHNKVLFGPFKWADSLLGAALSIAKTLILIFVIGKLLMAMPWSIGHNEIPKSALFTKIERSAPKVSFNLHSLPTTNLLK